MPHNPTLEALLPLAAIRAYCATQPIRKLSVFGSYLHGDFTAESDVDLLVEFETGAKITFFDLEEMQIAFTQLLGRQVDLRTPQELSAYFRAEVLQEAQLIYAQR